MSSPRQNQNPNPQEQPPPPGAGALPPNQINHNNTQSNTTDVRNLSYGRSVAPFFSASQPPLTFAVPPAVNYLPSASAQRPSSSASQNSIATTSSTMSHNNSTADATSSDQTPDASSHSSSLYGSSRARSLLNNIRSRLPGTSSSSASVSPSSEAIVEDDAHMAGSSDNTPMPEYSRRRRRRTNSEGSSTMASGASKKRSRFQTSTLRSKLSHVKSILNGSSNSSASSDSQGGGPSNTENLLIGSSSSNSSGSAGSSNTSDSSNLNPWTRRNPSQVGLSTTSISSPRIAILSGPPATSSIINANPGALHAGAAAASTTINPTTSASSPSTPSTTGLPNSDMGALRSLDLLSSLLGVNPSRTPTSTGLPSSLINRQSSSPTESHDSSLPSSSLRDRTQPTTGSRLRDMLLLGRTLGRPEAAADGAETISPADTPMSTSETPRFQPRPFTSQSRAFRGLDANDVTSEDNSTATSTGASTPLDDRARRLVSLFTPPNSQRQSRFFPSASSSSLPNVDATDESRRPASVPLNIPNSASQTPSTPSVPNRTTPQGRDVAVESQASVLARLLIIAATATASSLISNHGLRGNPLSSATGSSVGTPATEATGLGSSERSTAEGVSASAPSSTSSEGGSSEATGTPTGETGTPSSAPRNGASFENFLNELRSGLLATELSNSLQNANSRRAVNFVRIFQLVPYEPRVENGVNMVPVLIVGVRSADENNGDILGHAAGGADQTAERTEENSRPETSDTDAATATPASGNRVTRSMSAASRRSLEVREADMEYSVDRVSDPIGVMDHINRDAASRREAGAASLSGQRSSTAASGEQTAASATGNTATPTSADGTTGTGGLPPPRQSWMVYVFGGTYPENHPVLLHPNILSENTSYEDLLDLETLLGPVKPPVATQEEVDSAGGLFKVGDEGLSTQVRQEVDHTRCLICLNDFEKDDQCRKLERCGHAFHRECVDQWLTTGRNSCPKCRTEGVKKLDTPIRPQARDPTATQAHDPTGFISGGTVRR